MKVGILTFHEANNYGAVLQAYALQEAIKSLNNDVEIINYTQSYIIKKYEKIRINNTNFKTFFKSILSTLLHYNNFSSKEKTFNSFREKYLLISKEKYQNSNEIKGYEAYVVGSDQIWNFKITEFDCSFFLDFAEGDSLKLSYAASIGDIDLNNKDKGTIQKYINNLDHISVREQSGIEVLKELTNKELCNVLDPTLLLNKKKWEELCIDKYKGKKYIFVYSVAANDRIIEVINKVKDIFKLDVYIITDKLKVNVPNHKRCYGVGPVEFIELVKNATFVITDSFHGTAFSIIFEKNFLSVCDQIRGNRVKDLLSLLELNERIIHNANQVSASYKWDIDYKRANMNLSIEKNRSMEFLKKIKKD